MTAVWVPIEPRRGPWMRYISRITTRLPGISTLPVFVFRYMDGIDDPSKVLESRMRTDLRTRMKNLTPHDTDHVTPPRSVCCAAAAAQRPSRRTGRRSENLSGRNREPVLYIDLLPTRGLGNQCRAPVRKEQGTSLDLPPTRGPVN